MRSIPYFLSLYSFSITSILGLSTPRVNPDGLPHSLLSLVNSSSVPLYFRHAGYVGWLTPDETTLDDNDSTFVLHPGFVPGDGSSPTVSFENQCEFPGYYLMVINTTQRITLVDYVPENALNSTFYLRPGLGDNSNGYSFESLAYPGYFISSYGSSSMLRNQDTPCHYPDCPMVFAILPPYSPYPKDFNTSSTFYIVPPNNDKPNPSTNFTINNLSFELHNATGTIGILHDASDTSGFSFTPYDTNRQTTGSHFLGDLTLRARLYGSTTGFTQTTTVGSTASSTPNTSPLFPTSIWANDLSIALSSSSVPNLRVIREYTPSPDGQGILMNFIITNTASPSTSNNTDPTIPVDSTIEIGGFGVSMIFNSDWTGLSLEQNAATCSLFDPYIGVDAGYVRVVRIAGNGPILLVTPSTYGCNASVGNLNIVNCGGPFEAWRILADDPAPRSGTFEGFYAYEMHSTAYASNEWVNAQPWNVPTSLILRPGESSIYTLRLSTFSSPVGVNAIDTTLRSLGLPTVRGFPGYVLTPDMQTGNLVIYPPATGQPMSIASITTDIPNAINIGSIGNPSSTGAYTITVNSNNSNTLGRVRLSIYYHPEDGNTREARSTFIQTVQFYLLPSLSSHLQSYATFTSTFAWFNDTTDPFARAYSFMDYDSSIGEVMEQESRVFVVGLSDEAGAGTALGFAMATLGSPDAYSAMQLATFVNRTLINNKTDGRGLPVSLQYPDGGMRASLFWGPGMPNYTYTVSPCWDADRSASEWRSYNYPHPSMVLYSLYRLTRENEGFANVTWSIAAANGYNYDGLNTWSSYLERAAITIIAMQNHCFDIGYQLCQFGLMVASGYALIMDALLEEATIDPNTWQPYYTTIDTIQRNRTSIWNSLSFPFGSEFPWDSTGEEEIFTFAQRYGNDIGPVAWRTTNLTFNAVKAYTPDVPHWAYHGSSRRYWDFEVNGKFWAGPTERALQHYGSGINSVVLLEGFRLFPNDTYAVQAGFAGSWGSLTAIDVETGAPHMAFHGDAGSLVWEPYTADFGINMYGGSVGWGCYVSTQNETGSLQWTGYGCDVMTVATNVYTFIPYDPFRRYVFIGPLGLELSLRSGRLSSLTYNNVNPSVPLITINFATDGGIPYNNCPSWYNAIRMTVRIPTNNACTTITNVTFTQPSTVPPVVRGAYELDCNTSQAILSWTVCSIVENTSAPEGWCKENIYFKK